MPPTWGEVRRFCQLQGYRETRTDHVRYLKVLPDRSTSGTMVSMGVDSQQVHSQMWALVWKRQLRLASEDQFWKGLRGETVRYALPPTDAPREPLPAYLTSFLTETLHISQTQIATLTRAEAQRLLDEYHARELREP